MEGLINILMCSIYAQIFYCVVSSEPWLNVRFLCSSKLELSCSDNIDSNGATLWFFYMTSYGDKQNKKNILKIVKNDTDCSVTHLKAMKSTPLCACINHTGVICTISVDGIANPGDIWQCEKFAGGVALHSKSLALPSPGQDNSDCTAISVTHTFPEEETTDSTRLTNNNVTVLAMDATYTTAEIGNNSTAMNISNTNTSNNDQSGNV
ncbi:uncharacterized protein LOC127857050 [Dreissena polymorpha]|uniref:uncharacterized protein LOC127857050 n=1 Tax=Dreissena polymorpha TaxID=45954 RepID=UPI0022648387|nr:uncharacterized protein LOC127857050 [Dreissena polymorpha]